MAISDHLALELQKHMRDLANEAFGLGTSTLGSDHPAPTAAEIMLRMREAMAKLDQPAPLSCFRPQQFGGTDFYIVGAQEQRRTAKDVPGPWVRPGRVPSKASGRKGTRRAWKKKHPPYRVWLYREPTDVLQIGGRLVVTPAQAERLRRASNEGSD